MHEGALKLRTVLDQHYAALSDELASLFDSISRRAEEDLKNAAAETERVRQVASRETGETLNQTIRRISQAESEAAVLRVIAGAASGFAQRAVVLAVEGSQARTIAEGEAESAFDAKSAPAIASVIQSKDAVVAVASVSEIGIPLGDTAGERAYLLPVTVRQKVTAILIGSGGVAPAPLELFCQAAGMKIEALTPLPPPSTASFAPGSGLVNIGAPASPEAVSGPPRSWDDLNPEDQRLHLQAQRVARVKVAEMRLRHPDELRRGLFEGNVYEALKSAIDAARAEFLQSFLAKTETMVDYLHLEITRSLVHDDEKLLGSNYPGPMV